MQNKRIFVYLMVGIILLSLTACGAGQTTAEPTSVSMTPSATASTDTVPGSGASGLCANPLFPVVQGASWIYAATGPSGSFTYTDTITEVRADGFTVTSQFSDLTRTQEWSCTPEGLLALTVDGGNAAGLSSQGLQAEFNTAGATGITLPNTISAGMGWNYGLDIQGKISFSNQSADATGNVSTQMQEAGTESVTVPAGTFNATKINAASSLNLTATYQSLEVPVTLNGNTVLWYAPGVGLVKTSESGDIAGQAFTATTELQSYNIP